MTPAWDTISTIPAPPPDSTQRALEQSRAALLTELERCDARRVAIDEQIAEIDRRLSEGEYA